jgi:hypothetical protein
VRYRRVEGVLHQAVDGRAMLIAPAGDEVVVLNPTGSAVWDALADGGDVESLTDRLHGAHPAVAADAVRGDMELAHDMVGDWVMLRSNGL